MLNTSPPTNRAQTAPDAAPELRTRVYARDLGATFDAVRAVVKDQKTWGQKWRIVKTDSAKRGLKVAVPILVFTDDLTITLRAQDENTSVDVDSQSRVGQGDFGENRRHVGQFLRALDEKMKH